MRLRRARESVPLCVMPIRPVSLMLSGRSFVSSIVLDINSSNWVAVSGVCERMEEATHERDLHRLR
jgi:hypothetical protein